MIADGRGRHTASRPADRGDVIGSRAWDRALAAMDGPGTADGMTVVSLAE